MAIIREKYIVGIGCETTHAPNKNFIHNKIMKQSMEWRSPDKKNATIENFEYCKGQAIHKKVSVKVNRDVQPRVFDGKYYQGKLHRKPTASDQIKGTMSRKEFKAKNACIRTNERPSEELLERARKNSAKFDRFYI